jgi:hypothetical protein
VTQPPIVPGPYDPSQGWEAPPSTAAVPVAKPGARRWVLPGLMFLAAAIVAGFLLYPLLRPARPVSAPAPVATTPKPTPKPTPTAATFTVNGGLQLVDKKAHWKLGDSCSGSGGFQDIRPGADVVVSAGGVDLALAPLDAGMAFEADDLSTFCQFIFTVKDVPAGKGIYTLTIGHRPKKFTEAELRDDVSLTLGG